MGFLWASIVELPNLDFQRLALAAIDDIFFQQKVPVIVGGINYYIESVLWNTLVGASNAADEGLVDADEMNIVEEKDQSSDTSVLHTEYVTRF